MLTIANCKETCGFLRMFVRDAEHLHTILLAGLGPCHPATVKLGTAVGELRSADIRMRTAFSGEYPAAFEAFDAADEKSGPLPIKTLRHAEIDLAICCGTLQHMRAPHQPCVDAAVAALCDARKEVQSWLAHVGDIPLNPIPEHEWLPAQPLGDL
jgi:hypothetical protein